MPIISKMVGAGDSVIIEHL